MANPPRCRSRTASAWRGASVRALVRRRPDPDVLPETVELYTGDLARPETLQGLTRGVDVVFHLASTMRGSSEDFQRVDVGGSRWLLESALGDGVGRIVYASSLAVYPLGALPAGATVDERTPPDRPENLAPYARAKLRVERELRDAAGRSGLDAVILRPGLVYGPGSDPLLGHVPHLGIRRGDRYILFGDGRTPLPLTCVHSTVRAFALAGEVAEAAGRTFLIVDDERPTQEEYVETLSALTGRRFRIVRLPRPAGWLAGLAAEGLALLRRSPPSTTRRLLRGKWVELEYDAARARDVLGWEPGPGFRDCLAAAVRARSSGDRVGGAATAG